MNFLFKYNWKDCITYESVWWSFTKWTYSGTLYSEWSNRTPESQETPSSDYPHPSLKGNHNSDFSPQLILPVLELQFSHSVVSDSLQSHEPQHARPPCPSPTPGVHPNPCPLSLWCHSTISLTIVSFSSCPQSFPASRSFPMSQLFTSVGQSIGISASTSVPPMNTQDWSPLGWTSYPWNHMALDVLTN